MPTTDGTLEIGDRNRANDLEIADTRWNGDGTLFVTVRELVGRGRNEPLPIEAARRFARRALSHPEHTRQSRLIRAEHDQSNGGRIPFAVSRLDRAR